MKLACYGCPGGPVVTPEEFIERASPRYKEKGIFPYCQACEQIVEVYAPYSTNVSSRFDHHDLKHGENPLDDCIQANRSSRFKGLQNDRFDSAHGRALRSQFFEDERLKTAYAFMWRLCGKGNFPTEKFIQCILRADRKKIWSYKDIPLWVIPYILLGLENFTHTTKGYGFHFVIKKPSKSSADALWLTPEKCVLLKVFSDTGRPIRLPKDAAVPKTIPNPLPFSSSLFTKIAGDTSWVSASIVNQVKALQR